MGRFNEESEGQFARNIQLGLDILFCFFSVKPSPKDITMVGFARLKLIDEFRRGDKTLNDIVKQAIHSCDFAEAKFTQPFHRIKSY